MSDKPEVLFVCVHNAGRSQMAAALLDHHAKGKVVARSAGSDPAERLNPAVVAAMAEVGIDLSREFPKPLTDQAVRAADVVITMGCGDACPFYPGKRYEDWQLQDPAASPSRSSTASAMTLMPASGSCSLNWSRTSRPGRTTMTEANKTVVRRLVDEVFNGGDLEVIDELYAPELAGAARRWIAPFQASFPDVHMELVELIGEGDKVVGRFTCSATHLGEWLGQAPTGRRFEGVDEVWILRLHEGRIVHVWSLEDTLGRLQQLGLA